METKLIDGHNQFVFSEKEKQEIYDLYMNHGFSLRALMRKYNCAYKPMARVLDDIGAGHERGNINRYNYYYKKEFYDLAVEKSVLNKIAEIPSYRKNPNVNDHYFDDLRSQEVIYTIGFLYADGCNHNKKAVTMGLEEQDGYILERMNQNMSNENLVKYLDLSDKHDFGYTYKNQYFLQIHNKRIAEVLDVLGVKPRKSLKLVFPRWLHPSMYSHFVRGVFDGDGSICRREFSDRAPQHVLTITSTDSFCKALADMSARYLGILGRIYDASNHNGITKVFTLSGTNVAKKFMDWMYQDATIFLERKYDRYCKYFNVNRSLSE